MDRCQCVFDSGLAFTELKSSGVSLFINNIMQSSPLSSEAYLHCAGKFVRHHKFKRKRVLLGVQHMSGLAVISCDW